MIKKYLLIGFMALTVYTAEAFSQNRWDIQSDGSIVWKTNGVLPHKDHIEMSGEKISLWVEYGLDENHRAKFTRTMVFPTFRVLPDNTRSHISHTFQDKDLPRIYINNRMIDYNTIKAGRSGNINYDVNEITHRGIMRVNATVSSPVLVNMKRTFFPSIDKPLAIEKFDITNTSSQEVTVACEYVKKEIRTNAERSKVAPHSILMGTVGDGYKILKPGETTSFSVYYLATDTPQYVFAINPEQEERNREDRVKEITSKLVLETPDKTLNTAFDFAKIRGTESIYLTKGGYMHGPGGLSYYAALWANDQAEYINPFFAFLGDKIGNKSAMNSYRWFAKFMNPEYKPIPSSIVAEGDGVWKGAGDRGDGAMIAYGASRYALAYGNIDSARVLWPLIEWTLEYCNKKMNADGVVTSDSDELENRFPAGKANLSTNSLYYDALKSSVYLAKLLGKSKAEVDKYQKQADALKVNIEKYFGGKVEGFETYKYYETNDVLRAWICLPLTVGIYDRKEGTINALFSPRLWTPDGLATQAGKETFWDRSTLYALRGVFEAGETEKAMNYLKYYSNRRLLGEHVPYPVEAYPEGNQRHLSAESGLYCRIYTEGVFGMRPVGFSSFNCTPRIPKEWNKMALKNIHSFGKVFDLTIERAGGNKLNISVREGTNTKKYTIKDGATQLVNL